MSKIADINKVAAKYWSSVSKEKQPLKNRWWLHKTIIEHINKTVCGQSLSGPFAGFHYRLNNIAPKNGFRSVISIGCDNGTKEIRCVTQGIVNHYDLFELSELRIDDILTEQGESHYCVSYATKS